MKIRSRGSRNIEGQHQHITKLCQMQKQDTEYIIWNKIFCSRWVHGRPSCYLTEQRNLKEQSLCDAGWHCCKLEAARAFNANIHWVAGSKADIGESATKLLFGQDSITLKVHGANSQVYTSTT